VTPLAPDLWVASRPLRIAVGDIGTRMTVVRLPDGGLVVHSPVPLDEATRNALDAVGRVAWIVGPSRVHHFYLGDYTAAYPDALLCGAPGLAEKRRDLRFDRVLGDEAPAEWKGTLRTHLFRGAPMMSEVVFLHEPSRTLVLTDLAFNVVPERRNEARLFHWLVGATGRFGPHRVIRLAIRDREAARASLQTILGWDFDRVIVTHGEVLGRGGREALAAGFDFLLRG